MQGKAVLGDNVELRVSGKTDVNKIGGAIAKYLREVPAIELSAMGEAAVNIAVKGIIMAQSYLAAENRRMSYSMGFATRFDDAMQKDVTIILFSIKIDA